jgi:hypothetical protein
METTVGRGGGCCLGASLRASHRCQQCGHELCAAVSLGLLDHSAVVSFYGEHGVELSETPYWRLDWCVGDDAVTVRCEDPWRLGVDIAVDEETLQVTVDGDLDVVETSRV